MSDMAQRLSGVPGLSPSGAGAVRFSLEDVPERDRLAVFREAFGRSIIRYDVERLPDVEFHLDVKLQVMPGVLMMSGRGYGSCNRRTRELIDLEGSDDVGMVVNLKGPLRVTHGRGEFVLGDGEATLVSLAEVCSYTHRPPGDILAFRLPRTQFARIVRGVDDCIFRRIPSANPALRLLTDYVQVLARGGQGFESPTLQYLAGAHICDLMGLAVGATRDPAEAQGGMRAARMQAIKKDIASNLDQEDLSVAALAFRHGCTPRFIQRLFEAEGVTFTEYVLTQRLARAHRMLTDPRHVGDKISTIALDSGFADVSYFNRAFRQLYGDTPSSVRAQAVYHA